MNTSTRILPWFGRVLGILGILGCAGLTFGVWVAEVRLSQRMDAVFKRADKALGVVREGTGRTRERVQGARITSEEVGEALSRWTKRELGRRVVERLELKKKAGGVEQLLGQADRWMEASATSVHLVSQVTALANEAGASIPADTLDTIAEEIAEIRNQLSKTAAMVAEVQNLTSTDADAEPPAGRLEKAARIALRVAASLEVIEKGFRKIDEQTDKVQKTLEGAETRLQGWIVTAAIALTFILLWMAVGQVALSRAGYQTKLNPPVPV